MNAMLERMLIASAAQMGISLSDAQAEQFARYHEMLTEANARFNLTRVPDDLREAADRNYLDCMAPVAAGALEGVQTLIDVGSGAGFAAGAVCSGALARRSGICTGEASAADKNDGSSTKTETGFASGRAAGAAGAAGACVWRRNVSADILWKKSCFGADGALGLDAAALCGGVSRLAAGSCTAGRPGALFSAESTA